MRSRWLGCLLVLAACGDDGESPSGGFPGALAPGAGTDSGAPVASPGGTTAGTTQTTSPVGTPGGTTAGTAGGTTAGTTAAPTAGTGLPCEIEKILKDKCQTCHGNPPVGVPTMLTKWEDLQVNSSGKPGTKMTQRIKEKLSDPMLPMPPVARPQLTATEKAALEAYVASGAPKSTAVCTTTATTNPMSKPDGGTGTGTALGEWQPPDSDCEVMMDMRAHAGQTATDETPFMAPTGGDHYEIFYFTPTWDKKMHAIRIDPLIDNSAVLHHWLLYMKPSGTEPNGSHKPDSGLQSADSSLLSGWAPGNKSIPLGMDIGMQVIQGSSARFGIEIHYNTSANPAKRTDRSGARLCLTSKLRPKEASTHWLGTQAIVGLGGKFDAVGDCTVKKESHIVAMSPHMHKTGRYMKTIVTKKDGSKVTITDKPFDFNDQQIFPIETPTGEIVVQPGDMIKTTCSYDSPGPMTFGPGTDSEMCYNFIVAWPAGSLSNGSAGIVGGQNTCIDFI